MHEVYFTAGGFVAGVVVCRLYYAKVIAEGKKLLAKL